MSCMKLVVINETIRCTLATSERLVGMRLSILSEAAGVGEASTPRLRQ